MKAGVDEQFGRLSSAVGERLAPAGWVERHVGEQHRVTFTRPVGRSGAIATAQLLRTSFGEPERWPIRLVILIGAGYGTELDLMPFAHSAA